MATNFRTSTLTLTNQQVRATGNNLYVNGVEVGALASGNAQNNAINLSGQLAATGALLSAVHVSGSSTIQNPNFSGIGGTMVLQSGSFILISGGAGGGGSSNISVTGSSALPSANFIGAGGVTVSTSGANVIVSGSTIPYSTPNTTQLFTTGVPSGVSGLYISFLSGFATVPVVLTNLICCNDTIYSTTLQNVTTGGFTILFSAPVTGSGELVVSTFASESGNLYGVFTQASTAQLNALSGYTNSLIAVTGQQAWSAADNNGRNLSGQLGTTGSTLDNRINLISGYAAPALANYVYTTGVQTILGNKTFLGTTVITNLTVTGTQTIVNTQEFDVASNFITLNATGGARDAGIFISTGFTGGNVTGAVLGFDVPSNRWVFGIQGQQDDLNRLLAIASTGDVASASGALVSLVATLSGSTNNIFVHRTGDELISGVKTFTNALFISGAPNTSGIVLSVGALIQSYGTGGNIQNLLTHYTDGNVYLDNGDKEIAYRAQSGHKWQCNSDGITRMLLDKNGNLGIGTTTPSVRFEVYDPTSSVVAKVSRGDGASGVCSAGAASFFVGSSSRHKLGLGTNFTEQITLDISGNMLLPGNFSGMGAQYRAARTITGLLTTGSPNDYHIYFKNITTSTYVLPSPLIVSGQELVLKLLNTGNVILTGTNQFDTFDGQPSFVLAGQYTSVSLHAYGSGVGDTSYQWFMM